MTQLCINAVLVKTNDKSLKAVKEALLNLQKSTIEETGCIRFEILQDQNAPEYFTLWEVWRSQKALDIHLKAPYTQSYLTKNFTRLHKMEKLHLLSPQSNIDE